MQSLLSKAFKWIVLAFTILFWGLAFTAIKYSIYFLNPIELAAMRFLFADIFFALNILILKSKIDFKDLPQFFILGLIGVPTYHDCLNFGETYISSGVASLIISTAPIFVLLLSWLFLHESITKGKIFGVFIAFFGIVILSEPESGNITGILIVFVSAISAALYTVFGKKLLEKYDSITLTNYAIILGSIPLLFVITPSTLEILISDINLIFSVLFLSIFSTYLGYQGWYYFLKKEGASKASVFLLTIPPVSLIAGTVLLGEVITLKTILGSLAVIFGVAITLKS